MGGGRYEKLQMQNGGVAKIIRREIEGPYKALMLMKISSRPLQSINDFLSLTAFILQVQFSENQLTNFYR